MMVLVAIQSCFIYRLSNRTIHKKLLFNSCVTINKEYGILKSVLIADRGLPFCQSLHDKA